MPDKRSVLAVAATLLILSGCGDAGDSNGNGAAAGDAAPVEAPTDAASAMTGEDGWVELHDVPLPEPGTAVMELDGESYPLDIDCHGPGVTPEGGAHSVFLFSIRVSADFTSADGRDARLSIERDVHKFENWSATGGNGQVYDYAGQDSASVMVYVDASVGSHTSIQIAPSDDDPAGDVMPLVHVSPDGGFTAQTELPRAYADHDEALEGRFTIAGQCSAPWAELG